VHICFLCVLTCFKSFFYYNQITIGNVGQEKLEKINFFHKIRQSHDKITATDYFLSLNSNITDEEILYIIIIHKVKEECHIWDAIENEDDDDDNGAFWIKVFYS